jgi:hypothetical protein
LTATIAPSLYYDAMDKSIQLLIQKWNATPRDKRNVVYREEILPQVSKHLNAQYLQYLQLHKYKPYTTLVSTLSHDINILLLLMYTIQPAHCVVFYTADKSSLLQKLLYYLPTTNTKLTPVPIDAIDHAHNIEIIKKTIKQFQKQHPPVLCDITGGKKIISTQVGIIAHSLKIDIAYIDSNKAFIQWGLPQPGSELLYIQKPDNIINLLQIEPVNKLRIRYNQASSSIEYEAQVEKKQYRLGTKKIKSDDIEKLKSYVSNFYSRINASIIHNSVVIDELHQFGKSLKTLLFTPQVDQFIYDHTDITHLVIDAELDAIPWEILLAQSNIQLPLIRIPNRDYTLSPNPSIANETRIALIAGSGDNIPHFDSIVQSIKSLLASIKNISLTTFQAKSSFELKRFFSEHSNTGFSIVIYFGHATFESCSENIGLLCQDGSIFSIDDCDVLHSAPPVCVIVNACQSARCELFSKNSFALALINAGVDYYIGTHFFLELERSKIFLQSFINCIIGAKPYTVAFKESLVALAQQFGTNDISLYNYVYYGF